jgi:hypothetical protein
MERKGVVEPPSLRLVLNALEGYPRCTDTDTHATVYRCTTGYIRRKRGCRCLLPSLIWRARVQAVTQDKINFVTKGSAKAEYAQQPH